MFLGFLGVPMIYGIERRLDGGLAYPGTGDEHSRGRVVGGACWDLRQSGAMSADSTNEMIYRAISYLDVGDDSLKFADLLDALLISDDAWNGIGDNDITNGTPHDDQIFDAFLNDHAILGDFLAGTISENYTITNDTITLISDVSVAASKILTISDGTVIDLNGYKITCGSNGKIVRQGTVEFLPKDIYIKSGSDIISQYSTLSSAFSVFTTGETLVVNDGTHALTDNVTVSSGSTLELKPGTTLQFASGKKLTVNGTLLSVGTGSLITFEASGYGTWYGIDFTSSSSSNNVINSIFEDMTNGLVYTNCSYSNTIYGGEFDNNDISVNIINSSVTLGNCEIQNSDDYGVKCSSAGSMSALTDNIFADNYIGIWGDSNSSLHLGWDLATGGYNSIYNLAYDIQSNYSGTIYAEDNWWGGVPPSPSFGGSATIDYDPYLSSDPNSSGGLEKANSTNKPVSLVNEGEFVLSNRGNIDTTGIHEFDQIYLLVVNKDNQTALPLMENLVNKYPSSLAGELALIWVNRLCNDLHIKTHAVEFLQAYGKKEIKTRLSAQARGLLINQMVNANEFSQAAAAAEDLLQDHIASDIDKMTLFELATIYWYYLDEKESGKLYFQEYIKNYPNDDLAASARITLGIDLAKSEFEKGISPSPIEDNVILPESYELYQNYPNPFNPTTTIKYSIMEPGRVNIDLFNIRGEKVITLFDDEKTAGTHMVQFIASHLPSGIYFYQITCNEFNMIRKMILLK